MACGLIALSTVSHAQSETEIYNSYDAAGGLENLNLNGRAYPNPYKIRKGNDQFYKTDQYLVGSVVYSNQPYYNVDLRYDIYHDILIYRPKNISNNIGTILEKEFVSGFTLDGRDFVNLSSLEKKPDFVTGYYEKCAVGQGFTLYAKHHKFIRQRNNDNVIVDEFNEDPGFLIEKDGVFTKTDSRGDFAKLFPDQKERIKDFYQSQKDLSKKDPISFMTKLFRHITNAKN
ncbi:hypothetical protein [Flavobacterium sp.]|uniref:hypothetical protein n=1 Tax=Flavobacterium sp. TaxID=239 RepID=UPI00120735EE|nr:hypothetical protein [Flavobacterium sp.]RZJ73462.1 MAG: hypothetical protein EOO49_01215 [Flavobacterium sp.]